MRIAFLTPYGPGQGGMEVFNTRLQAVLEPLGHSFEWFTFSEARNNLFFGVSRTIPFLPQREIAKAKAIASVFNPHSHTFDLVIANDYFGMYAKHPKVVMVTHGYYPDIYETIAHKTSWVKKQWGLSLGRIQKSAAQKSWKHVTVSPRNAEYLMRHHIRVDETISHGIDTAFFSPQKSIESFKQEKNLPENPFLLYVGSNAPWKNTEMVDAMSAFWKTVWLGAKPLRENSNNEALPKLSNQEMPLLYSNATALLHPAFHEGFGYAPIESMSCGTPPIFTRAGIGSEIVKEIPEIIVNNPINAGEVKQKISFVLENKKGLGKRCRAYVEKNHNYETWSRVWNEKINEWGR